MLKQKYLFTILLALLLSSTLRLHAQIEKVIVETYYISDANDATDTTGGRILAEGSKTFRIFIDLEPGYKIKRMFGDQNHTLLFSSSDTIFNNLDRPSAYFGYLVNKSWFSSNPTIALDSWLSLGLATKTHSGVPKSIDPDNSFIGGTNNGGGSAEIASGLLSNADILAGVPLTLADGLVPATLNLTQWLDYGFKDIDLVDTTVFGPQNPGNTFQSNSVFLQQNAGVSGADSTNQVLVAQITTKGDLRFELNLVVVDSNGVETTIVSRNPGITEIQSSKLIFPLPCGCRDPRYLEFSNSYGCDLPNSCRTLIVLGCMDKLACNYNPIANSNVQETCCYPGYCNDRNLEVVCPEKAIKSQSGLPEILFFPNPAGNSITLSISGMCQQNSTVEIYNLLGTRVLTQNIPANSGPSETAIDLTDFVNGLYLFHFQDGNQHMIKKILKKQN